MYGLQNILTEQGVSIEQQGVILELINSAKLLEPLSLLVNLGSAGFNPDETNRIIQATLNATYNPTGKFDPFQLLNSLATEDTPLKEKTKRWFDQMVKSTFIERREMIRQHITPAMLLAFTPRPPMPKRQNYDTIIVLDSTTQPIMDGLDYIKCLLDTRQINCLKVLIPQTLAARPINSIGFTSAMRAHLPSYLQMNGLQSRVKQDEHLSQQHLADYLIQLYSVKQDTPQYGSSLYQTMYTMMRSNCILIVTTQDNLQITNDTVAFVYEALRDCKLTTEVIYTLQKKELTNDDLLTLLVEQFYSESTPGQSLRSTAADMSAAAAAAAATANTPGTTTQNGTTQTIGSASGLPTLSSSAIPAAAAEIPEGPNSRGMIAVSIAAVGIFAAANPQVTATVTNTVTEAAKQLAQAAVKAMFS